MAYSIKNLITEYYKVSDQWYPNYPNDTVKCRVTFFTDDDPLKDKVMISFWGNDDFGVEKIEFVSRKIFYKKRKEIKNWLKAMPSPLNAKWLLDNGFVRC